MSYPLESAAPEHFFCPLTLEVMCNPVQHKTTGHSFERGAIMEWIYFGKATCPLTRINLHPTDFAPNTDLENEIKQWKKDNKISICGEEEDLECSCKFDYRMPQEEHANNEGPANATTSTSTSTSDSSRDSINHLMKLRNKVLKNREARLQQCLAGRC